MDLLKNVTTREGQTLSDGVFIRYDILILEDELKVKFALRYYESEDKFKNGFKPVVLKEIPSNFISKLRKKEFQKMDSKTIAFRTFLERKLIKEIEAVTGEKTISTI